MDILFACFFMCIKSIFIEIISKTIELCASQECVLYMRLTPWYWDTLQCIWKERELNLKLITIWLENVGKWYILMTKVENFDESFV